jgi:hypothetical protein
MGNNASQSAAVVRERLVRTWAKKLAAKLEQVLTNKPVEAGMTSGRGARWQHPLG